MGKHLAWGRKLFCALARADRPARFAGPLRQVKNEARAPAKAFSCPRARRFSFVLLRPLRRIPGAGRKIFCEELRPGAGVSGRKLQACSGKYLPCPLRRSLGEASQPSSTPISPNFFNYPFPPDILRPSLSLPSLLQSLLSSLKSPLSSGMPRTLS